MTKCACCAEETETYPMVSILDFRHTFGRLQTLLRQPS